MGDQIATNPRAVLGSVREIHLPPSAPDLLESMRAIGYSFESALADLIDNSIAAAARTVNVRFSVSGEPYVAIIDDGTGMSPADLTSAMRHGSRNPDQARDALDLGRFGLGLKTASLSHCRMLTVISLRDGTLSARRWDLDYIAKRRDWMLLDIPAHWCAPPQEASTGTCSCPEVFASAPPLHSGPVSMFSLPDRASSAYGTVDPIGLMIARAQSIASVPRH